MKHSAYCVTWASSRKMKSKVYILMRWTVCMIDQLFCTILFSDYWFAFELSFMLCGGLCKTGTQHKWNSTENVFGMGPNHPARLMLLFVIKSTICWPVKLYSSERSRRFGGTYRLRLQGRNISQGRNQQEGAPTAGRSPNYMVLQPSR
jgi:hypothetical protein